jgi:putative hemolysin
MYIQYMRVHLAISVLLLLWVAAAEAMAESAPYPLSPPAHGGIPGGIGMANPSAVYCTDIMGYEFQKASTLDGETGYCVLPDGRQCESWEFLAGTCGTEYDFCGVNNLSTDVIPTGGDLTPDYALCVESPSINGIPPQSAPPAYVNQPVILITDLINRSTVGSITTTVSDDPEMSPIIQAGGPGPAAPPSSWDWRSAYGQNWVTPVRNQGGCGSCWAFGAVASIEAAHNIEAWNPNLDLDLSEQFVVSYNSPCMSYWSCAGGWHDDVLEFARTNGIPDESCWPYTATDSACNPCANWASRLKRIDTWGDGNAYQYQNFTALKEALVKYGPVGVAMGIGSSYGGYWDGDIYRCTNDNGLNHVVLLVGYNDAGSYWIMKNSWGTGYGTGGYYKVGYGECYLGNYYSYYADQLSPPRLSGSVIPASGPSSTVFNFTAFYQETDMNLPTYIRVNIDGVSHDMSASDAADSDPRDNKTYYYATTLSAGAHSYNFSASSSGRINQTALVVNGITVLSNPPTLANGSVSPRSGKNSTLFNYTVYYADSDSQAPSFVQVQVDGAWHAMSGGAANYSVGGLYSYATILSCGNHTYRFNASDGEFGNVTSQVSGSPRVNCPPALSGGQVTPLVGNSSDNFNFTVTYQDSDADAPVSVSMILDGAARGMTASSANYATGAVYYWNGTVPVGSHIFLFNASDGNYTASSSQYTGPLVFADNPACTGANPINETEWNVNVYTACLSTSVLPTSTRYGPLIVSGGSILNITYTNVYLNNTRALLDGAIDFDGSVLSFIR